MKRHTLIGGFACVWILSVATMLRGQALPAASRLGSIQLGAGWFLANPDFGQKNIQGVTFYSNLDFGSHLGAEGEIHYTAVTPTGVRENLYLVGPRYIVRRSIFDGYAKVLFGAGHFGLQLGGKSLPQTNTYFTYVLGGGIDIHVVRHLNIRAFDFEYQKLPGFPPNGLSPYSGSVGAAYVFH